LQVSETGFDLLEFGLICRELFPLRIDNVGRRILHELLVAKSAFGLPDDPFEAVQLLFEPGPFLTDINKPLKRQK